MPTKPTTLKSNLRTAYDQDAPRREQYKKADWKVAERAHFFRYLQTARASTLLEIGAGAGYDSLFFQQNGLAVTATDLSPQMVALCRAKGLEAHVRDLYELGFPVESFDAVWALNCLLHVPRADLPQALAGIRAVLKPGGLLYYGVYGGVTEEGVWEGDHLEPKRWFTRYGDEDLKAAVAPFFEIVSFKAIHPDDGDPGHFQSMVLTKTAP